MIIPGRHLDRYDPKHLAAHAMEGANRDFASNVRPGDVIVAGRNFGCGSSREQAVTALKESDIAAVVAQSFARIFYRNAVNLGLFVFTSDSADSTFEDGEIAILDVDVRSLMSKDGKKTVFLDKIPERAMEILSEGGLIPYIKSKLESGRRQ